MRRLAASLLAALVFVSMSGCARPGPANTPTPTKTPRPTFTATAPPSLTSVAIPEATAAPTVAQPDPPTATVPAGATPEATPTDLPPTDPPAPTPEPPTETALPPTETAVPPTPTVSPPTSIPAPTAPPQRGGDWDLEAGFYEWASPYEDFVGHIANGWSPLIKVYAPESAPRFNENKFPPNIHSGERSQEISFDYRNGEIGLWRGAAVIPGHRYTVEAWAKYAPSPSGLHLFLGIDLTGGKDFEAATVNWYPWQDMTPDQWIATRETVRATGEQMTIFLRTVHPVAEPGGNTMFDNISLVDLGP